MLKTFSFFLKSVLIGVIISSIILLLVPDLRQGSGLPLNLFSPQESSKKLSFNAAVNAAGPAVVNIYSQSIENAGYNRRQAIERTSLGSGVIMSSNGYILTCYHVIANAKLILVGLQDGRYEEAQILGFDRYTDLAVLKIPLDNLHPIPQQAEPNTMVGDVVLAIGNPLNLGQTITQGIVSRISNNGLANYVDFVQTDVSLKDGNSGGALVDSEGVLVGINNANFQTRVSRNRVENVDGVAFAIPYVVAKKVMDEIVETGKVTRGVLGFVGADINTESGIVVNAVGQGSPAERAGLQVNDVILAVDGIPADSIRKTLEYISSTRPGTQIEVEVSRNNQPIKLTMTVAEL
ncbi:trypsin-like peptidase domain-containing protein [Paraglaciecola aestuariivivens]